MGLFDNNESELGFSLDTRPTLLYKSLFWVTLVAMMVSIYMVFMFAPTEVVMGDVQRIFYFHVGTAWPAFFAFGFVFVCSILYLVTKKRIYDIYAKSAAEIGVVFMTLVMITGPMWAKASWNVWWSWEPRLTTSLILWFIYIAYVMVRNMDLPWEKKARLCSVFGIIGFIDVPIVYFSVQWWNTNLHPVVVGSEGGGLEPAMFLTMQVCIWTFTLFFFLLLSRTVRAEKSRIELNHIKTKIADKFSN